MWHSEFGRMVKVQEAKNQVVFDFVFVLCDPTLRTCSSLRSRRIKRCWTHAAIPPAAAAGLRPRHQLITMPQTSILRREVVTVTTLPRRVTRAAFCLVTAVRFRLRNLGTLSRPTKSVPF